MTRNIPERFKVRTISRKNKLEKSVRTSVPVLDIKNAKTVFLSKLSNLKFSKMVKRIQHPHNERFLKK